DSVKVVLVQQSSSTVVPGQPIIFDVDVSVASDTAIVSAVVVHASGLFNDSLVLPVPGTGPFGYRLTIDTPLGPDTGQINILVIARIGPNTSQATTSFRVADDGPPRMFADFRERLLYPGDTAIVDFGSADSAYIKQFTYAIHGGLDTVGTVPVSGFTTGVSGSLRFPLPPSAKAGDSIVVDLSATDGFGNVGTTTRTTIIQPPGP
ncbi:MAG TPA: hypothetical protein VGI92_14200, partial [Gemmatimonadales bacterium]